MDKEKDLGYYKNLKYDVVLKKKGALFVLFIPELACVTEDESLEKAYEKLELEKERIFKKLIELDAQDFIREPVRAKSIKKERFTNTLATNLLPFFVKLIIILLVGGILVKVVPPNLKDISSNLEDISSNLEDISSNLKVVLSNLDQSKIDKKINQISRIIYHVDQMISEKYEETLRQKTTPDEKRKR